MIKLNSKTMHPFIRCVGMGTGVTQREMHIAYDFRLICILEGEGVIEYNGSTRKTYTGDLFLISPGSPYRVFEQGFQKIIVVNFDWTHNHAEIKDPVLSVEGNRFEPEKLIEKADWSLFLPNEPIVKANVSENELTLAKRLYECYSSPEISFEKKDILLCAIFTQLAASVFTFPQGEKRHVNPLAEKIYAYIGENYAEKLTLKSVSEAMYFHPSYINRVISAAYGESFRQLLIAYRLSQARWLLENTDESVEKIAASVGFYNGKHLTLHFRKKFGVSPSQLR